MLRNVGYKSRIGTFEESSESNDTKKHNTPIIFEDIKVEIQMALNFI